MTWHQAEGHKITQHLEVDPETGLSAQEAKARLGRYGANELKGKAGKHPVVLFLLQFNQPLLYILLIAGVIKALLGSWVNAGVIWGVTVINAIIGFVQESKAENAIAALASSVTTDAMVRRDGQQVQVSSRDLVPGDIVLLTSGDKVPADLRLLRGRTLQINESSLTGESVAVEKQPSLETLPAETPLAERHNMAYAGSFVTFGQGEGIVVETGLNTETGRISKLMDESTTLVTPLTRKFDRFSKTLLKAILAVAALTFAVGMAWGNSPIEMFEAAVALAVSAIPEGLPAVVTITLAIGVSRMARRSAIVRKLPAVETLGSATVICSDKTGTLTENQMTVQSIYAGGHHYDLTGEGYNPHGELRDGEDNPVPLDAMPAPLCQCLLVGMLCNDSELEHQGSAWSVVGDPTEGALLVAARKAGLDRSELNHSYPRIDSIPFESEFQYMATLHQQDTAGQWLLAKGSVETLVPRCNGLLDSDSQAQPIDDADRDRILLQAERMASRGLRVLCFAAKTFNGHHIDHDDLKQGMVFLGLQGMIDPPRAEAIQAVEACKTAGIEVKMITGDHKVTAAAIAERMNLSSTEEVIAYTGKDLAKFESSDLTNAVQNGAVFARVAPEQKLRLVEALQAKGHIVAMTGDGVNDAPALKQADIGIAMGNAGTEVAKEAADMILTNDNFASIEAAVEEGRNVFRNLMKAIAFILPVNGGESMTILLSVLIGRGDVLPILSLQVLWLNMVNSIAMTVPLAFEPKSHNLMNRPPRNPSEPLLSRDLLKRIALISVFNWILIFGVFEWIRRTTGDIPLARTMAIQALVAGRIIYLLSISQFWASVTAKMRGLKVPLGDVSAIGYGIAAAVVLQVIFSQVGVMNFLFATAPLSLSQWLICIGVSLPMFFVALLANRLNPQN
ncbi:HAD-IC family P-type ATPase [Nodosilinea sp. LEGE 06152]|uniref:cation-translocating P-type ATPase n=1 Tax=Nodosilinea sp. LEGE 06152 TaxID=2777966 RepID=UPI00188201B2|nr:HAD-IC family P-type ATPase [Nodosilinea sp. LEGE 06152]MBE9156153.1 HAD-IC family P-type ATPase [Nodosilinea sp. LEGE 06152]